MSRSLGPSVRLSLSSGELLFVGKVKVLLITPITQILLLAPRQCTEAFHPLYIDVVDFTDGACSGAKLELTIVSEDFDKVPLIQRHRKVQALLKEDGLMDEKIHALTIKAWTPEQWEAKK